MVDCMQMIDGVWHNDVSLKVVPNSMPSDSRSHAELTLETLCLEILVCNLTEPEDVQKIVLGKIHFKD